MHATHLHASFCADMTLCIAFYVIVWLNTNDDIVDIIMLPQAEMVWDGCQTGIERTVRGARR